MILAQLLHALNHPDEYVFEWRGGELYIRPRQAEKPAEPARPSERPDPR
jgi:hypothetical protein